MTSRSEQCASGQRVAGPAVEAAAALKAALESCPGVLAQGGAALTFEAVRATGAHGQLFVSIRENETGVVEFLAPAERSEPYRDGCIVLGTSTQIHHVAGIVRRRVTSSDVPNRRVGSDI